VALQVLLKYTVQLATVDNLSVELVSLTYGCRNRAELHEANKRKWIAVQEAQVCHEFVATMKHGSKLLVSTGLGCETGAICKSLYSTTAAVLKCEPNTTLLCHHEHQAAVMFVSTSLKLEP
jgi:hypothetical protein